MPDQARLLTCVPESSGERDAGDEGGRPGLKAAYHGQCMTCHKEMKLEKPASTNCVACHEKKTN